MTQAQHTPNITMTHYHPTFYPNSAEKGKKPEGMDDRREEKRGGGKKEKTKAARSTIPTILTSAVGGKKRSRRD